MAQEPRVQSPSSGAADPAPRWVSASLLAVVVAGVYMLAARLSLSLLTPDGVAVFWPAAGIAAGALIAFGPAARWPVVAGTMIATIAANLLGDRNIPSAIVFALCNAGEAVLAAYLIERWFGSPFDLDRLRHVLGLIVAAGVAAAVSGIGGALGFVLFHGTPAAALVPWQDRVPVDAPGIGAAAAPVAGA